MEYINALDCSQEDYYALVCAVRRYLNLIESRNTNQIPDPYVMAAILGIEKENGPCT